MSEDQNIKEYKHGDTVHLTVELRDDKGAEAADTVAILEGHEHQETDDISTTAVISLTGWVDEPKPHTEVVLTGEVYLNDPGLYYCYTILTENSQGGFRRNRLHPPLQFRVAEPPDYVWQGPEVLSVGEFW